MENPRTVSASRRGATNYDCTEGDLFFRVTVIDEQDTLVIITVIKRLRKRRKAP